jgi:thiosulfate/3-mercaptopyruvate sulfurtransferase
MSLSTPLPSPLIDAAALRARLAAGAPIVLLDCSFELADAAAGEQQYLHQGRLPGSRYAHLDRDLAGPTLDGDGRFRGRHPLPSRAALAATLGRFGITSDSEVVVYDRHGAMFAARAWWLLRWIGHTAVTVLDGGLQAWVAAGGSLDDGAAPPWTAAPPYPAANPAMPTIEADALAARLGAVCLIDARAAERFRGETEPLDAVAGHIPGALSRPFKDNLGADGRFLPADELRAAFAPLVAGSSAGMVVHQCGSGVTACHNLLAAAVAGLGEGVLYPGSWSEWCADPARPVGVG